MKLVYDPEWHSLYGRWFCPKCFVEFYRAEIFVHDNQCPDHGKGVENCEYHFGPEEAKAAKVCMGKYGFLPVTSPDGFWEALKAQYPQLAQ